MIRGTSQPSCRNPLRLAVLALLLGGSFAAPCFAGSDSPRIAAPSRPEDILLAVHNVERARVHAPPLVWDAQLAAAAQSYAARLAIMGRLVHSPKEERGSTGENLWMGTRGYFPIEAMVRAWSNEKRFFRPGPFPNNSTTGNWVDVGHYTAMIWPTTTRVGCALGVSGQNEVLVCRYGPNGNINGRALP